MSPRTETTSESHRRYVGRIPRPLGIALSCVVALSGCGGSAKSRAPAEHTASATERAALTQVAADLVNAYEQADAKTFCGLLTPAARDRWRSQLAAGDPALDGRSCPQLILSDTFGDPADQPPAIDEAGTFKFRRVTTDGTHATLTFPDGRSWHLIRAGDRWLITDIPLVPRSLGSSHSS